MSKKQKTSNKKVKNNRLEKALCAANKIVDKASKNAKYAIVVNEGGKALFGGFWPTLTEAKEHVLKKYPNRQAAIYTECSLADTKPLVEIEESMFTVKNIAALISSVEEKFIESKDK